MDRPVQTVEYSTDAYNSLPNVASAAAAYRACHGDLLTRQLMPDLFRRHAVQANLGLALLHRHHHHTGAPPLGAGESMTALSGTKSPAPRQLGVPAVWRLDVADGHVIPVEFSLEAAPVDWGGDRLQAFVKEFAAVLREHSAEAHFGLCLYPGDGYPGHIEVEDGRDTVGLSPEEVKCPAVFR
ncbi:hypothetical protein ISF_06860 [Cordyceps fumosorosea ARSEF 2679]|uniref:Uncharacterized protein n=1 Tax=Cordyceps fumosorosea (strain ARSEF 2679) TaxID=1081104 RepID=A0A167R6P7_CORFA|nr:hypothetical protein ISF_06860 [Cordyceps fumosorosea ARSEF 2679]OAA58321.1 hypothetical protein ISF_06860 [Cordyceps fumosorosea ARSEF 2679]